MSRLLERIENFNRAYKIFCGIRGEYVKSPLNNLNRYALIQAFEVVYELGWKVIKDYLETKDLSETTPRDVIKTAFNTDILPTAQVWIDMAKDRNISSHEYNEDKIDIILEKIANSYYYELENFHKKFGGLNE